jgi:hypothetical protein
MASQLGGFRGLDKGEQVLNVLSDFWQVWFKDQRVLTDYLHATSFDISQGYFDLLEGVLSTSIQDIPVFHREKWYSLVLLEELVEQVSVGVYRHPKPKSMHHPGLSMYNRVYQPSVALVENSEFYVKDNYIYFNFNPLTHGNLATSITQLRDGTSKKRVSLWCFNSAWDDNSIYDYYGWMLDLQGESSEVYKALVQGVWKLYTNGASIQNLESAANVILGIPVSRTDGEIVKHLDVDAITLEKVIITDSNIYRVPSDTPLGLDIIPGSTLRLYQPLTRIVKIEDHLLNPAWVYEQGASSALLVILGIDPQTVTISVNEEDNTIITILGEGGLTTTLDVEYLSYNTFHLKVEGNVGGTYLQSQNQIREILRPGLPAYVDYVFRIASRVISDYDFGSLVGEHIRIHAWVTSEDEVDGLLLGDTPYITPQVLQVPLRDIHSPSWVIGGIIIGPGNFLGGGRLPVDDYVTPPVRDYGGNYPQPSETFDESDDLAPVATISGMAITDEYGGGVYALPQVGGVSIGDGFVVGEQEALDTSKGIIEEVITAYILV